MARKKNSRRFLTVAALLIIGAGLVLAFQPRPALVDIAAVTRGEMFVTINEEGRTRVHNAYVVSTPITGRLQRVEVEPGDTVVRGETVVARMLPASPSALDARTREQARATLTAAEAGLRVAQADLNKTIADKELADADLDRTQRLNASGITSQAALERAERSARSANAALDTAEAAISMREAEVANAQAHLISFDDQRLASALGNVQERDIPLLAPATGRILRIMQQSETTLSVGTPIMEIGNIEDDLEVVVELLSTDAVRVQAGQKVIIDKWGGPQPLAGVVERVDPWGFTKFSALGVEEQRVNATIRLTSPPEQRASLGHGYRVEARIVVWEKSDALLVATSALFRDAGDWAVFRYVGGVAELRTVEIDANNGLVSSVSTGLSPGDLTILYPSSAIADGAAVSERQAN